MRGLKLGPPAPGTQRQLTTGEAGLLGASPRWHVAIDKANRVHLLRPNYRGQWVEVPLSPPVADRVQRALMTYWTRSQHAKGVYVRDADVAKQVRLLRETLRAVLMHPDTPRQVRALILAALEVPL